MKTAKAGDIPEKNPRWHGRRASTLKSVILATVGLLTAGQAHAQPATAEEPQVRLYTLGTQGGPIFNTRRAQPANAVVVGDRIYLVDAGNGVARQLSLAGLDFRRVSHIFITHNHDDHNADWGTLMGLQWTSGRRNPVHVYGPVGTESMRDGFLRYFQPNAELRAADAPMPVQPADVFKAHDIKADGLVFQDDRVKVTAAQVCHFHFKPDAVFRLGPHKSYAYRFETRGRVIVFSGDTGPCPALVTFAKGADILVHEVVSRPLMEKALKRLLESQPDKPAPDLFAIVMRHMVEDHSSPEEIGLLAAAAGVRRVVLTHFVPGSDDDPDSAYVDGVKKHFNGPVSAAKDLDSF